LLQTKIDSLKKRKRFYNTLAVKENTSTKNTAKNSFKDYVKETTEIYGENDYITDNGTIQIKANNKNYQREKIKPLSKEEKRIADSIRQYNERFIVRDSIAEIRAMLKQKRKMDARKRDSIFKANLDPNYRSSYNPPLEPRTTTEYKPKIRQGVFTTTTAVEEQPKLPVKNIDEYFCVQIYIMANQQMLDMDKYPFLAGYEVKNEDGFYHYYIGRTKSPNLAIELCKSIRARGISDATVIKFTNGIRAVYKDKF
jgi:hypothetical protein